MEKQDYILHEIQKIGILIQAMLGNTSEVKKAEEDTSELSSELFNKLNFNLEELLTFDTSTLSNKLTNNNGLNGQNIELLADLLVKLSVKEDNKKPYLQKAFYLYNFVNTKERTFCLNRDRKIKELELELNS